MNVVFGKQNVENRWDILREFWQNSIAVRKRWRKVDRTHAMNPNKSSNLVRAANSWLLFFLTVYICLSQLIDWSLIIVFCIIYIYANSGFSGLLSLLNMFRFVGWVGPIRLGYKSTHVRNSNIWKSNCLLRSWFRFPRFSVVFHIEQWLLNPCWLMISSGIILPNICIWWFLGILGYNNYTSQYIYNIPMYISWL